MLKGYKFKQALVMKLVAASGGGDDVTKPKLSIDDKSLRDSCANAVVVSVLTKDDVHHQRIVDCIIAGGALLEKLHTELNKNSKAGKKSRHKV